MFQTIILPAIAYGFTATSMPGPMQAYLLNITLNFGWRRGLLVILSPLIVDGPIILLTVFVLGQIPDWALQVIRVAGGLLLLWIAWGAWKQVRAGANFVVSEDKLEGQISNKKILGTAIAMNTVSPGPYLFWSTITGPLLLQALNTSIWAVLGLFLGFYGMFLGGMALLVIIFDRVGSISSNVTRYLLIASIGLLLWYGTGLILADALGYIMIHRILGLFILLLSSGYIGWTWYQNRENSQIETVILPESAQD